MNRAMTVPWRSVGWFHNRLIVKDFKAIIEITSPTSAKVITTTATSMCYSSTTTTTTTSITLLPLLLLQVLLLLSYYSYYLYYFFKYINYFTTATTSYFDKLAKEICILLSNSPHYILTMVPSSLTSSTGINSTLYAMQTMIISKVDLNAPLPQSLINYLIQNLAGILLYLLQQQAIKVKNNPDCKHATRIKADSMFYRDWVLPKFRYGSC